MIAFHELKKMISGKTAGWQMLPISLLFVLLGACSSPKPDSWTELVPKHSLGLLNVSNQPLESLDLTILEQLSNSTIQPLLHFQKTTSAGGEFIAIAFFPASVDAWKPLWIARSEPKSLQNAIDAYAQDFRQSRYLFLNREINRLFIDDREFAVAQLGDFLVISESSLAVEESVRSFLQPEHRLELSAQQWQSTDMIWNAELLGTMINQVGAVRFRPLFLDQFEGFKPAFASDFSDTTVANLRFSYRGNVQVDPASATSTVQALTSTNRPLVLDRYLSSDASGWAIFRKKAEFPSQLAPQSPLDSLLISDADARNTLLSSLDIEFAYQYFEATGLTPVGEDLFIRNLADVAAFRNLLYTWSVRGFIERDNNIYRIDSDMFGQTVGSHFCEYPIYYVGISGRAAVISPRQGLTQRVQLDKSRSRVVYYDRDYLSRKQRLPESVSAMISFKSQPTYRFLSSFLAPNENVYAFLNTFDNAIFSLEQKEENTFEFVVDAYDSENREDQPFYEKWLFPLAGGELSGTPTVADIFGSRREEIIFATTNGQLYALASDGTVLFQKDLDGDKPVGSPLVYDWYANGSLAVMLGAGNKIYAWNSAGEPLPKFPITLNASISSPLSVGDLNRDGIPEMIVGLEDRNIYVLNGRGVPLPGWPQRTNSAVKSPIQVGVFQNETSLLAFSENGLFNFDANGRLRPGYPSFINAPLQGVPVLAQDHIFGAAADGHIYTWGSGYWPDSLNVFRIESSVGDGFQNQESGNKPSAIQVSEFPLSGTPALVETVFLLPDSTTARKKAWLVQDQKGNAQFFDEKGRLILLKSMGQAPAPAHQPFLADLDKNKHPELVMVGTFGRIYAWTLRDGKRFTRLPNAGMQLAFTLDTDGDGKIELIAKTREGLRAWTINPASN